jgi:hypothetical protein
MANGAPEGVAIWITTYLPNSVGITDSDPIEFGVLDPTKILTLSELKLRFKEKLGIPRQQETIFIVPGNAESDAAGIGIRCEDGSGDDRALSEFAAFSAESFSGHHPHRVMIRHVPRQTL